MIICLRQIILRKAIYRITIPLLYPRSQTSSLECVFVWLCTQYTPYFFPLANIHVSTHAPLPFCQTFRIAICFQECICIIVWYHWTPVSLHSFFQSTNTYILSRISMEPKLPALLSRRLPTKDLYLNAALSFTCLELCPCPILVTKLNILKDQRAVLFCTRQLLPSFSKNKLHLLSTCSSVQPGDMRTRGRHES